MHLCWAISRRRCSFAERSHAHNAALLTYLPHVRPQCTFTMQLYCVISLSPFSFAELSHIHNAVFLTYPSHVGYVHNALSRYSFTEFSHFHNAGLPSYPVRRNKAKRLVLWLFAVPKDAERHWDVNLILFTDYSVFPPLLLMRNTESIFYTFCSELLMW